MNRFEKAFDEIHASQQLKEDTMRFIREKTAEKPKKRARIILSAAAACCAVMLIGAFGVYGAFFQKISYVSVDVNPSIELSLNRLNRVVSAVAMNEDGEKIISSLNLSGMEYEDAVKTLLNEEETKGYLEDEPLVSVAVYSDDDSIAAAIYETLSGTVADEVTVKYGEDSAEVIQVDSDTVAQARECGLTAGRYCEYMKIKEYDDSITPEECNNSSMRQLRKRAQQCQAESGNENGSGNGNGSQNGNGNKWGQQGGRPNSQNTSALSQSSGGKQYGKGNDDAETQG